MSPSATEQIIDVRPMTPRERHPAIFNMWESVGEGESMLLVNDHDPVPLYYQFAAEQAGFFKWEYLANGPDIWRVRISKGHFCDPGFVPAARPKHSCAAPRSQPIEFVKPLELDTRPIFARGDTPCHAIDEAVANLIPGQLFVLLAPFEPAPLYLKLGKQGFDHASSRLKDGSWRIEFRKQS